MGVDLDMTMRLTPDTIQRNGLPYRAKAMRQIASLALLAAEENVTDGERYHVPGFGDYYMDISSLASADGISVIQPDAPQPGRYKLIGSGGDGAAIINVPTWADVQATEPISNMTRGSLGKDLPGDGGYRVWLAIIGDTTPADDRYVLESTVVGYRPGESNEMRWHAVVSGLGVITATTDIATAHPGIYDVLLVSVDESPLFLRWRDGSTATVNNKTVFSSIVASFEVGGVNEGRWEAAPEGPANVRWWGVGVGDGIQDEGPAFNLAIADAVSYGFELYVPPPVLEYRLATTVSHPAPHGLTIRCAGHVGQTDGTCTFSVDTAIKAFSFGEDVVNGWRHMRFENAYIVDRGGTGVAGLELIRATRSEFRNIQFSGFTTGAGLLFNSSEWTQYCQFYNVGCDNCLYGIRKQSGNLSDCRFFGGYWNGTGVAGFGGPVRAGSIGFWDEAGTGGRNKFYCDFNYWETGMELNDLRVTYICGSFEQSEAQEGTGTAIRVNGSATPGNGWMFSVDSATHFFRWGTGIEINGDADQFYLWGPTFAGMPDPTRWVVDNSGKGFGFVRRPNKQYTITGVNQGAKEFTVSQDASAMGAGAAFIIRGSTGNDATYTVVSATGTGPTVIAVNEAIPSAVADGTVVWGEYASGVPVLMLPDSHGLLVRTSGSGLGGLYLSSNSSGDAVVGVGVTGPPTALVATNPSPSWIKFNAGRASFFGGLNQVVGASLTNASFKRFAVLLGGVEYYTDGLESVRDLFGTANPNGNSPGFVGSTYRRKGGGASLSFYVKESGESTGTNDAVATNELRNSGATFQADGVGVGDLVLNDTDGLFTTVVSVDSQTQLTLSADIFTATGKSYTVGRKDGWVAK